jgi:hypothetical protein
MESVLKIFILVGSKNGRPVKVKVKVKFTLEQAIKAQRGSRGIALLFL